MDSDPFEPKEHEEFSKLFLAIEKSLAEDEKSTNTPSTSALGILIQLANHLSL